MSWENEYKSKLTTAEKAVELIKSGNRVVIVAGFPLRIAGATNMIRVVDVD